MVAGCCFLELAKIRVMFSWMHKSLACVIMVFCVAMAAAQNKHVVTFYNVENLYDTINAPYMGDDDMLPLADKEWDSERYFDKVTSIASVISDMTSFGDFPVIVGLAEVENRGVVEDIANSKILEEANYGVCHYDSDDERAIDVAMLYRKDLFNLHGSCAVKVDLASPTRDILVAWGELCGEPALVMIMHWPSRVGGVHLTRPLRAACAAKVREIVDSVNAKTPNTKIIIMGDMNDTPRNHSVRRVLGASNKADSSIYNPFAKQIARGSMVYDGRWYLYDQIMLSQNLMSGEGLHLLTSKKGGRRVKNVGIRPAGVFSPAYLLDRHGYPLSTYEGDEYTGGVSDHLPVYVIMCGGK